MDDKLPFDIANLAGLARPRYGNGNPEFMVNPFWEYMVRQRRNAWWARNRFAVAGGTSGPGDRDRSDGPVWCFTRYGRSASVLAFDTVYIGGEHEDWYDPDFCIYNDVVVENGNGEVSIYGYPQDVFPPTDFHTATPVGSHIWLIGSLGYKHMRLEGVTQVMRLETSGYGVERVETSGDNPGWISRHRADFDVFSNEIRVRGGQVWRGEKLCDNHHVFALSLGSLEWRDLGPLPGVAHA